MGALKIIDTWDEKLAARPRLSLLKPHIGPSHFQRPKTSRSSLRLVPELLRENGDISAATVSDGRFRFVDPSGLFSIVFGGGGTATGITGGEASGGVFVNPGLFGQAPAAGLFGSVGASAGLNISGDVFAGVIFGGAENVSGTTVNGNLSIGPLSISGFFNPSNGDLLGFTVGLGPSATVVGASTSISSTGTIDFIGQPVSTPVGACGR